MGATQIQRNVNFNLIKAREDASYTQAEVAKILNLNQTSISKFELGIISPTAANMKKFSELYKRDVTFLFFSK